MIIELDKKNIDFLNDSFISKEYIEKELSLNPYGKVLLLIENDEIIGYLYYSDIYERVEINQIEIKEPYRNNGKGTQLMEFLIKKIKKDITLEVSKENTSAIKLYEKMNFHPTAIRKGYYNGVDGILMERKTTND